jgi:hypothetical protein
VSSSIPRRSGGGLVRRQLTCAERRVGIRVSTGWSVAEATGASI